MPEGRSLVCGYTVGGAGDEGQETTLSGCTKHFCMLCFMVMASKFSFTTEINMSEVEKEKEGLVQVTTISRAQPTVRRGRNTEKPEADDAHLLPRVSGGTRCAPCVAALWFHWTLKHLEHKNKDNIFLE